MILDYRRAEYGRNLRIAPDVEERMKHVGVDGCRGGWFAVTRNSAGLYWAVFPTIDELAPAFPDAHRILIDIPIGLPWADAPIRPCDSLARKALGRLRRSSVFPVPCREALAAQTLDAAKKINLARIGRSVGKQAWAISPKIAEVDSFLRASNGMRAPIREVHPEVCFWALAGRKPMQYRKSTPEGVRERLGVLKRFEPTISGLLADVLARTRRTDVQPDDVLDAAVAFLTAEGKCGPLASLAGTPSHDPVGLPIEMVFVDTR